jgi:hypothetical protein
MSSKEKQNENLYKWISGILGQISNGYPLQRSAHNLTVVQTVRRKLHVTLKNMCTGLTLTD